MYLRILYLGLLFFVSCVSAFASSNNISDDLFSMSLEELLSINVYSATRSSNAIYDAPASISLLTREEIESMGYTTFTELITQAPGFYSIPDTYQTRLGVRGNIEGGIAVLINGVPQHNSRIKGTTAHELERLNIPVEAIDQIEIIRGPMSVIYGNNAFMGAINIVTNDETKAGSFVSYSTGNEGSNRAFTRYVYNSDKRDFGFVTNFGWHQDDGLSGLYADMLSPEQEALLIPPGSNAYLDGLTKKDDWNFELSGYYGDLGVNIRYSELDYSGLSTFGASYDDGVPVDIDTLHLNTNYKAELSGDLEMVAQLTYNKENTDLEYNVIIPDLGGVQNQETERIGAELTFNYTPTEKLGIVTGLQYQELYNISNVATLPPLGFRFARFSDDVISADAFIDIDYVINDTFNFFIGTRYNHIDSYDITAHDDFNNPALVTETFSIDDRDEFTSRIALITTINESNHLKFMYGTATQDNRAEELFDPEEIETYEINYVSSFDNCSVSVSVFYSEIEKLRSRYIRPGAIAGDFLTITENSSIRDTRGVELITNWRPTDQLSFELSGVYQKTKDKSINDSEVGNSPRWLAKLKAIYKVNPFTFSLSLNYVDSMYADHQIIRDDQDEIVDIGRLGEKVDDYITLGANIRIQPENQNWYVNIHGSNLTDEDIRYAASEYIVMDEGLYAESRRVLCTVGYEF